MSKIWTWIAGAGGIFVSLLLSFKWGKASERADRAEATFKRKEKNQKHNEKIREVYAEVKDSNVGIDRFNKL